ncbi:MAG TPA: transcription initiation factor E subunit alpha [Candidatus Thermoplasmatota archaeon]|nr:transcription initiation factor E subunit alpha [Candidatus Thermoplasmatota archaeon]
MTGPSLRDQRIVAYIEQTSGPHGLDVAKLLEELGEATDTDIAERLSEKPSHVRKVLYDLYEARIAEYYQKKDKETGWQTFHWKLNLENALRTMDLHKRRRLEELEAKLKVEEESQYFACVNHPLARLNFDQATEVGFRCPECSGVLEAEDKRAMIAALRREVDEARKALAA